MLVTAIRLAILLALLACSGSALAGDDAPQRPVKNFEIHFEGLVDHKANLRFIKVPGAVEALVTGVRNFHSKGTVCHVKAKAIKLSHVLVEAFSCGAQGEPYEAKVSVAVYYLQKP